MRRIPSSIACLAAGLVVAAAIPYVSSKAAVIDSGQRSYGNSEVEPAFNDSNGNVIYLLTPLKNPFPSKANSKGTAPLYLVLYPLNSAVPASDLNCQPTNCDHSNVLPFADTDYGALPGADHACLDFNSGNPCSPVEGHDHLVGVAPTGDFNQAWQVMLVVFTHAAFLDGKINTRITTLSQIQALQKSGDAIVVDSGIAFNCSVTPETTYELGTPVVIPYP